MCPERTRELLARPRGFEPLTFAFGGQRSIQLSYGRPFPSIPDQAPGSNQASTRCFTGNTVSQALRLRRRRTGGEVGSRTTRLLHPILGASRAVDPRGIAAWRGEVDVQISRLRVGKQPFDDGLELASFYELPSHQHCVGIVGAHRERALP
jgi:hypothetical protein